MGQNILLEIRDAQLAMEEYRQRLVRLCQEAVNLGEAVTDVASAAGVTRATIYKWVEVGDGPEMVDVKEYLNSILLLLSSVAQTDVGSREAAKAIDNPSNKIKMTWITRGLKAGWFHIDMLSASEKRECIKASMLIDKLNKMKNPDSVTRASIPTIEAVNHIE